MWVSSSILDYRRCTPWKLTKSACNTLGNILKSVHVEFQKQISSAKWVRKLRRVVGASSCMLRSIFCRIVQYYARIEGYSIFNRLSDKPYDLAAYTPSFPTLSLPLSPTLLPHLCSATTWFHLTVYRWGYLRLRCQENGNWNAWGS